MGSTFGGLSVGATGLAAHRRALEVVGHNVVNANTPGYSRQRVDLASIAGGSTMVHTGMEQFGNGVDVVAQSRIVDAFLTQRANDERAAQGQTDELRTTWSRLEAMVAEPGDQGLAAQLEAYWDAWDAVANTPDDLAARTALLQRGAAIAATFQTQTRTIDAMTTDALQRADALTVEVNDLAAQIAELNGAVISAVEAGAPPNDLLDQRDELVRQLSTAIDVTTRVDDRGRMHIAVAGAALVSGERSNQLTLDATPPAVLRISNSTVELTPTGGRLGGLLQSVTTVLPGQQAAIDAVAVRLADTVNAQHLQGKDLDEAPGVDFFTFTGAPAGARTIVVNPVVAADPRTVAAAAPAGGRYDGANAIAVAELAGLPDGADADYRAMLARLGVDAQTASRRADLQTELTGQVDQQREAVSGVSIDEEMTAMISYQQAYQASARYVTAVDEMLQTLITGTGLVGR